MVIKSAPAAHVVLLALGFVLTVPVPALAYVDPGTGSYLFQLAAAGLLAGMFTLRRYWEVPRRRSGAVGVRRTNDPPDNDVDCGMRILPRSQRIRVLSRRRDLPSGQCRRFGDPYASSWGLGCTTELARDVCWSARRSRRSGCAEAPAALAVLMPEQIPFISYPYEWCFSQAEGRRAADPRHTAARARSRPGPARRERVQRPVRGYSADLHRHVVVLRLSWRGSRGPRTGSSASTFSLRLR